MKDKIPSAEFGRGVYAKGRDSLTGGEDERDENVNKVFNLDDDALNFSSLDYYYFSNYIQSSKSFEAVLKSDLKRIENFKEKFDLEKFKQRSKKYKKLVDYWHKLFNQNFIGMIEYFKKYMKFDYDKIPKGWSIDYSALTDNTFIETSYIWFLDSTARGEYCFDKYFDRFNFNYDIDTKTIKEEIGKEMNTVFQFNAFLSICLDGNIPFDIADNLKKYFGSGRQLEAPKKTKYKLVAEYITIMEKHFNKLTGLQKKACELAGVIPYSFSSWKNEKNKAGEKKNFDIYLKWRKEKIPTKKVEELKTNIANYLKSS